MASPEQNHKLHAQVDNEEGVIPFSDTVLKPGAVMVVAPHAVLAQLAVLGSHGLLQNTIRKRKKPTGYRSWLSHSCLVEENIMPIFLHNIVPKTLPCETTAHQHC